MAVWRLLDFKDIYEAVLEQLKIPTNDTTTLNRVKRDINMVYINEVAPACRWKWLTKRIDQVHKAQINTGTADVSQGSTTVILSDAPSVSVKDYKLVINGHPEIYTVSAHTAATTTVTLSSAFTGTTSATATFKIYKDWMSLPTNCRETVDVRHDWTSRPMTALGPQKFEEQISIQPLKEDRPMFYSTDDFFDPTSGSAETEDDRYRMMRLYPALYDKDTTLHITYTQEVDALNLDADEPLLPIEDRVILVYGALRQGWLRERNESAAALVSQQFQAKLAEMKNKYEDATDMPRLEVSAPYLNMRRKTWNRNY